MNIVSILEILGRSEQGMTLPFRCHDKEKQLYYVKGKNTDRRSLIAEWICGNLAEAFGLPIAPYVIVDVPVELIEALDGTEWAVLGSGLAFGSKAFPHVLEINWEQITKIPKKIRQDIIVFDWWIRNDDRNLTVLGGNPNLLWDAGADKVVVIDHNAAFSEQFNPRSFIDLHIFHDDWHEIIHDCVTRAEYITRLQLAFNVFEDSCNNIPEEWWWAYEGVPAAVDLNIFRNILLQFNSDKFWGEAI